MTQTWFIDLKRDDGTMVTVEYSASGGEPNFDCPGHICDGGGSGPVVETIKAWLAGSEIEVKLTDAEDERFCEEIGAQHVDEPDDPADSYY